MKAYRQSKKPLSTVAWLRGQRCECTAHQQAYSLMVDTYLEREVAGCNQSLFRFLQLVTGCLTRAAAGILRCTIHRVDGGMTTGSSIDRAFVTSGCLSSMACSHAAACACLQQLHQHECGTKQSFKKSKQHPAASWSLLNGMNLPRCRSLRMFVCLKRQMVLSGWSAMQRAVTQERIDQDKERWAIVMEK